MMEKQVRREAGLEEDRTQKHIIAAHKELREAFGFARTKFVSQ